MHRNWNWNFLVICEYIFLLYLLDSKYLLKTNCGVALNVSKSVFIEQLCTRSISVLSGIRESGFSKAISADWANPKDILVGRKESAVNPLNIKLSEDIWTIVDSIRKVYLVKKPFLLPKRPSEPFFRRMVMHFWHYSTLFDIEKAFDSVEHPVLLKFLFDAVLNEKGWRLIKSWYKGSSLCVKISGHLSLLLG